MPDLEDAEVYIPEVVAPKEPRLQECGLAHTIHASTTASQFYFPI